jgi:hypothetical protein
MEARSVPTYRNVLESVIMGFGDFRRALRSEDREIFDELMKKARLHASAGSYQSGSYQSCPEPTDTLFLAILVELAKDIKRLREEVSKEKGEKSGGPRK